MSNALKSFAKYLNIFLAEKGWSQSELARALDMKPSQVNRYATGQTPPGLEVIEKIAMALDRPVADFFKEEITLSAKEPLPPELLDLWNTADEIDKENALIALRVHRRPLRKAPPKKESS